MGSLNALRYIRMVLWSFFGVRRGTTGVDDLQAARPLPLLGVALALAALLVLGLASLARLAVGHLG